MLKSDNEIVKKRVRDWKSLDGKSWNEKVLEIDFLIEERRRI